MMFLSFGIAEALVSTLTVGTSGIRLEVFRFLFATFFATHCLAWERIAIPPSADTCLFELDPEFNMGGQRDIVAGTLGSMARNLRSRALYRFKVADAVPEGAVITAARFRINVVMSPEGKRNSTFALHRVLADWGEGTKRGDNPGGDSADAGEATWLARFHPDRQWSTPGGAFGSDFADASSAERQVLGDGTYQFELNEQGVADLQDWLDAPAQSFGWALASQEEAKAKTARRWASREHRTVPPMLEIDFESPVTKEIPLPILTINVEASTASIRFLAESGVVYRLERSLDLTEWTMAGECLAVEESQLVQMKDAALEKNVFYRVSVMNSCSVHP